MSEILEKIKSFFAGKITYKSKFSAKGKYISISCSKKSLRLRMRLESKGNTLGIFNVKDFA